MDKKNIQQGSKVENLEESLYIKDTPLSRNRVGKLHDIPVSIEKDWSIAHAKENEDNQSVLLSVEPQHSFFLKKFFMTAVLFFLVAVGFGMYTFFLKSKINPEGSITVGVVGSTFTKAGDSLPLTIEIDNKNNFDLEIVDLIVEYPRDGEKPTASLDDTERERITIGTIPKNQKVLKDIQLTLFGKEGDKKEIHLTLEYSIANSSAIFQKHKTYQVVLSSSPITSRIIAPKIAVPNQPYHFTIEVSTNTEKPLQNILLAVQYPTGFLFKEANQEPVSQNNIWDLGVLMPGVPKQIEIKGVFTGVNGDERSLRALVGTYKDTDKTTVKTNLGTLLQNVLLEKPFLSTDLFVNTMSTDTVVINPGETIQGQIKWKNNLPNQVFDLEIGVKLKGDLLERNSIEANDGFYNSKADAIVWNKNTVDSFVRVPAGAEGIVYFTIPTRKPYTDGSQKNPKIEFEVFVKGLEDSQGSVPKLIESLEQVTVKVGGDLTISGSAQYKTGQFVNTGYPPKLNTEISYTLYFEIDNPVNEHYQAELRAKLPPNVQYKNIFYPQAEKVVYDEKTGELIWRVGTVPAVGPESKILSLQISVIPSLSQLGTFIPLLNTVSFKAIDKFTNKTIIKNIGTITNEIRGVDGEDKETTNGQVIK